MSQKKNYDGNMIDIVLRDKNKVGAFISTAYLGWNDKDQEATKKFDTQKLGPKLEPAAYGMLLGLKQATLQISGIAASRGGSTTKKDFDRALARIALGEIRDQANMQTAKDIGVTAFAAWQATIDTSKLEGITPELGYKTLVDVAKYVFSVNGTTAQACLNAR